MFNLRTHTLPIITGALIYLAFSSSVISQDTTTGYQNVTQPAPGTLLSRSLNNGSERLGRTTTLNYLNGWLVVGGEIPGSDLGSDYNMRVYDISNPRNPDRKFPSDFNLNYPGNRWYTGDFGWNAHATAQGDNLMYPQVLRVQNFGAPVQMGGNHGIPNTFQSGLALLNRSSQQGPWNASMQWYDSVANPFQINFSSSNGFSTINNTLGTIRHTAEFGGGEWHPIFFGNHLIYIHGERPNRAGIVVYRLDYNNFDSPNIAQRSVDANLVGFLPGGFSGYWPTLFSDGDRLYVVGADTAPDEINVADITEAVTPGGDGSIELVANFDMRGLGLAEETYPTFQQNMAFIHKFKINMTRLIAGNQNPIVLTLDEGSNQNQLDTSQMSLPLGNLWVTGGLLRGFPFRRQGMGIWVHQSAPDTTRPSVTYHLPRPNQTNYPRGAPLSFMLHEHSRGGGLRNTVDFLVRRVFNNGNLGAPIDGFLIHDFAGILTFTPEDALAANATYQVDFVSDPSTGNGFRDPAGNYIQPYTFRFSTGGGVANPDPLELNSFTSSNFQPEPDELFTVSVDATGGTAPLEYRFNFNNSWTAWGTSASATRSYPTPGTRLVSAQVRDATRQTTLTDTLQILVTEVVPTGPAPTASSTMAAGDDPNGRRLWVVNPDADTVSVLNANTGAKIAEHAVGGNPKGIARDANGRYWISCHDDDQVVVLRPDGTTQWRVQLGYGSSPWGVCASPDGETIFVTMYGSEELVRYNAANPFNAQTTASTPFPTPKAIAINGDGSRVFVTRFISPELQGEVAEFAGNSANLNLVRTIPLRYAMQSDASDRAAGVPNYLSGIAISPAGDRAAVVSKQDNVVRGEQFGLPDLTHETTVRSVVSFIDLTLNEEDWNVRQDFDNSDSPSAVAYTPLGDILFVTLQGNNRLVGIEPGEITPSADDLTANSTEASPASIAFDAATGLAPQGVLIDAISQRIFVQNFMGRSVTVLDAEPLLTQNQGSAPLITTTNTVSNELLSPEVLLGKQIFYNAADVRMSADGYISCASCHIDGGHDGRVWDFTGRGEGFRRTTDLRGRSGMAHGNVHWSANFDEIQDFEHDMRGPFGGEGFLDISQTQFASQHASPASAKTGLNPELDALAAYVASLGPETIPKSSARNWNGSMSQAAIRGEEVFNALQCASCHSGNIYAQHAVVSVNSVSLLQDLGTRSTRSGMRLGGTLPGIDVPTLLGVHASENLFHDGSAEGIAAVFEEAGGTWYPAASAVHSGDGDASDLSQMTEDAEGAFFGGGGNVRGMYGGTGRELAQNTGVRFRNVDGGSGGLARISIRYVVRFGDSDLTLRVNGAASNHPALRQEPDDNWRTSGWRWLHVEAPLNPGTANNIAIVAGDRNLRLNGIEVANADDLLIADPHRQVLGLPAGDQADLIAYIAQQDGRDAAGELSPEYLFANWVLENLTTFEQNNPNLSAPESDHDSNGIPNVVEFALAESQEIPLEYVSPTQIATSINTDADGITVVIERSVDLQNWRPILTSVDGRTPFGNWFHTETLNGNSRELVISLGNVAGPQFFRVRVSNH